MRQLLSGPYQPPPEMAADDHNDENSDEHLLAGVRSGNKHAYAALWKRHAGAAYSVARTFTSLDPDDLVSEAFARVLEALDAGGGPTSAFRPYLTMTVRNIGRYQYGRVPALAERERRSQMHTTAPSAEDAAIDAFEQSAALTAFRALPRRWQEVLWYSDVDGLKPREVSKYIGIPANAVSALAVRARRAFRDQWIQAQLRSATSAECEWALSQMGSFSRNSISSRSRTRMNAHLETCANCRKAAGEASRLTNMMATLVPPLLGAVGAAAYSAATPSPAMASSMELDPPAHYEQHESVSHEGRGHRRILWGAVTILLASLLIVIAVASMRSAPSGSAEKDLAPSAPSPAPFLSPIPFVDPPDSIPASEMPPLTEPENDRPPESRMPDAERQPGSSPEAPGNEPGTPETPPLSPPTASLSQTDTRFYPTLRGTADPGAVVEILDENGVVVGAVRARATGLWQVPIAVGDIGAHTVAVRQTLEGVASAATTVGRYIVDPPPVVTSPTSGGSVTASRFAFSFSAPAGTIVQRELVGVTRLQTLRMPANERWLQYYSVPPGKYTFRVRNYDPETGEFGPWSETSFTASD